MYSGGSGYCFGCGFHIRPNKSPYLIEQDEQVRVSQHIQSVALPEDFVLGVTASHECWIRKYDLSVAELLQHGVGESKQRDQVIFPFYNGEGRLLFYQARNFSPLSKSRYFTRGNPNEVLPIYSSGTDGNSLAIVEDCLSAIKIARQSDSMPCLGSDLPSAKIKRLAGLYEAFTVWLDSNMYPNAQRIARRFQLLGREAKAVWTELDPKYYNDEEISKTLLT